MNVIGIFQISVTTQQKMGSKRGRNLDKCLSLLQSVMLLWPALPVVNGICLLRTVMLISEQSSIQLNVGLRAHVGHALLWQGLMSHRRRVH